MNVWLKVGTFIIVLIFFIAILRTETMSLFIKGDIASIEKASGGIMILLAISLMLMIIQNLFTVIPLILLISINVSIYGFWYGYLWSWFSSIIGGVISFLVVRYWFQTLFDKWINVKVKQKIADKGFYYIFIGRVFPFMPTSVVNIAAGASTIRLHHFIWSTVAGNLIYMFFLALIPLGILSMELEKTLYIIIGVLAALFIGAYKIMKKKQNSHKESA
jgi:uncharacterized membrane protein YdjX (TVP38/TMEM64 family)